MFKEVPPEGPSWDRFTFKWAGEFLPEVRGEAKHDQKMVAGQFKSDLDLIDSGLEDSNPCEWTEEKRNQNRIFIDLQKYSGLAQ